MNKKILWVDDEWRSLPEQVDYFKKANISVDCADSLEEGVKKLREHEYDGVLLDCIMPMKSNFDASVDSSVLTKPFLGLEFLDTVGKMPKEKRPPVVVLTIAKDERLLHNLNQWIKRGVLTAWMIKSVRMSFSKVVEEVNRRIELTVEGAPSGAQTEEEL